MITRAAEYLHRPWPLRRRLVLGVSLIVMATLAGIGVLTVLSLRASTYTVIDTQLSGSLKKLENSIGKLSSPDSLGPLRIPQQMKPLTEFSGQGPDNLIVTVRAGEALDSAVFVDSGPVQAPAAAIDILEAAGFATTGPRTLDLGPLGPYRVQSQVLTSEEVLLSGVAIGDFQAALTRETTTVIVLISLGLLLTVVSTIVIVRLALRPLARVAQTAQAVARTPLGRGRPVTAARVGSRDTDPRTEVGKVGETLNSLLDHVDSALAELMAVDHRMRQFITDASHELRTPLAAIQGYAELTRQDSAELPDNTEYALGRIEAEAQRMGALVSDLLTLARLDEGHDLELDEVDLGEIAVNAVNDAAAAGPQHRWRTEMPGTEIRVRGDRTRLYQLLAGLLTNARVHTPRAPR
ncbi:sensor histidine kinase [Nocardia brasiliensis]|uniref:sensor histidine kinase n=1 Tax=Nocardia brasiliensis TaxID=37326 RepID=UPI003D91C35A